MFKTIPVRITNTSNVSRAHAPVTVGVAIPRKCFFNSNELFLQNVKGDELAAHLTPLASWPDGSIKWLLLDFQADLESDAHEEFYLAARKDQLRESSPFADTCKVEVSFTECDIRVDTGNAVFTINKNELGPISQVEVNGVEQLQTQESQIKLTDADGAIARPHITSIDLGDQVNLLRRRVSLSGFFGNGSTSQRLADFEVNLTFYAGKAEVKVDFCLLNPKPAKHPKGVWDLGDEGSFFFNDLTVQIHLAETNEKVVSSYRISAEHEWAIVVSDQLEIYQDSSGGDNWQSENHVNHKGLIPVSFKGYKCFEQGVEVSKGDRASPLVHVGSGKVDVTAYISDFWQNFPKGVEINNNLLVISLFPARFSAPYELQGGEQKTHTFYLDFSRGKSSLEGCLEDLRINVPEEFYVNARVMPWLTPQHKSSEIQRLIERGVDGEQNFFDKREAIDEYGWRNYGDIYADHEQLEYKGNTKLISHYNNQYDALYGFIRQYILTGDDRWHRLLSSLARHIVDIDIYHTTGDRDEYNGGLFWHTDHYLTAFACSHRTFSARHADDFLYGEIGGGPGGEHCYTTGLTYYYFMTGEIVYKDAALKLTGWITRLNEGSGAILERLMQFKSKDVPVLKRLLKGEVVQKYKYPFTRGTGNYIVSLIDAYNLTGDGGYIETIEKIVKQTIHPRDNIELRNLSDIENGWSYLILLQAIAKYLETKVSIEQIDDAFIYAKDSFLHYAEWIVEYESPFLFNPEKLEFPNQTWTAQDLRKANVLFVASCYSLEKRELYLNRARYFVNYVASTLSSEETRYYSRILIILMQNDIDESGLDTEVIKKLNKYKAATYAEAPLYKVPGVLYEFLTDMFRRLLRLSLKNEKRWLSYRMNS